MESPLVFLKFSGMFPRIIDNGWGMFDGRSCSRVGKVSLIFLVLSMLSVLLRITLLVVIFAFDYSYAYSDNTVFDLMGSRIWDANYLVCELLTAISVLSNHKMIKICFNKIFLLFHLCRMSPEDNYEIIPTKSILSPWVGACLSFTGLIFKFHTLSLLHTAFCVLSIITVLNFIGFCRSTMQYLATLQSKIHSFDQTVLSKFQNYALSDKNHFLNILLYRKSLKHTQIQQYFEKEWRTEFKNRNPVPLLHLRLQEILDSLIHEFMDSVGLAILVQMANITVTLTFGTYFTIKSLRSPSFSFVASVFFLLYAIYVAFSFINMTSILNLEVSLLYML